MILNSLRLTNFRRFTSLEIDFHPELTVIVAPNGQGKTTILDAATIALGTFTGAFDLGKAKHIDVEDARYQRLKNRVENEHIFPVKLEATLAELEQPVVRELTGIKNKTTVKNATNLTDMGKALMAEVRDLKDISLPLIAYYGSGRLWNTHKNMTRKAVLSESRTTGYEDCLTSASSFKQVQQWMTKATYAVIQQQNIDGYEGYTLESQIKGIQKTVDSILNYEGWSNFHYSMHHEQLAMTNEQFGVLPLSLLSDGVRAMVSMVADMAWRCAKLNPHLGEAAQENTQGIVFVDEVDMHLHPRWQQTVIQSLRTAFPRLQFIITSHSPQVLTTVPDECIRIIDDGKVYSAPSGTKGAESSRILKRVFGVDTRPQADENTQLLQAYEQLVYADQWNDVDAKEKRAKLDEIFAGEEPKLTELDLYIENRKWEIELEKDQ